MAGSWKRFPLRWPFWVPLAISFLFFGWRSSWFNLIPENVLGRSLYTNIQFNKITRFWSRQWKSVTHLSRLYMPHVRWHRILDSKQTYTTPVTIANLLLLFGHLFHTHRIHGWFVYLLLVDFYGKCGKSYGIWQHYVFPSDLYAHPSREHFYVRGQGTAICSALATSLISSAAPFFWSSFGQRSWTDGWHEQLSGTTGVFSTDFGDKFIQKNRCQEVCWNTNMFDRHLL